MRSPGLNVNRRDLLKMGLISGGALLLGANGLPIRSAFGASCYTEEYPVSPFILNPFIDPLPVPKPLAPSDPSTWRDPATRSLAPPGRNRQSSDGGRHQIWPDALRLPRPVFYRIRLEVNEHRFTSSLVRPINKAGEEVIPPDGIRGPRSLPGSTIYGFNGTFPGPMINAQYGKPALVRFENHLHQNPLNLDRQDFGARDWSFLTHLHNAHTAPESDGNPNFRIHGYQPNQWSDNLYLNWPPDNDPREKQSFFWFHDHVEGFTSANVYKGMVGLYPIYDPVLDPGDETKGLRLPGVRRNRPDGSFIVDYDIPLAFYDCRLDDGVTIHEDCKYGSSGTHPEWWGKTFFQQFPNHGFVGDLFTVNGKAYPVLEVKRRRYRFRMLCASISRIYEFKLMRGTPAPAPGTDGQWQLPNGQQCMRYLQIATDGGLLPAPINRDSIELWPAKRREVIVDFKKYMDGSPTRKGDVVYLVNTMKMTNGRKPDSPDPDYRVPIMKFVIGDNALDRSRIPVIMRPLPPIPPPSVLSTLPRRRFEFERSGSFGGDIEWLINGLPFDPLNVVAKPKWGSAELWEYNTGGGWVHPVHNHMEEHRVISRDKLTPVDDRSREDVVALGESETVLIYRKFRTFLGKYVSHCHNLAHEDHAMMYGWEIVP